MSVVQICAGWSYMAVSHGAAVCLLLAEIWLQLPHLAAEIGLEGPEGPEGRKRCRKRSTAKEFYKLKGLSWQRWLTFLLCKTISSIWLTSPGQRKCRSLLKSSIQPDIPRLCRPCVTNVPSGHAGQRLPRKAAAQRLPTTIRAGQPAAGQKKLTQWTDMARVNITFKTVTSPRE